MNLPRSVVSALALSVALPLAAPLVGAGTAEAANIIIGSKTRKEANNKHYRVSTLVAEGTSGDIETVTADVSSDAGRESLALTESDAWLHGAATIAALPATDAELSLTLYDSASATLIAYSGRLGADGSVTLAERAATDGGDCTSRLGCTVTETPDLALLGAEVFASAGGYDLVIDLSGADAHDVAYAAIVVTEWENVDACLEGTRDTTLCGDTDHLRTTAEVGWDTIGTVWEAALTLEHDGPIDVKVKVRADEGPTEVVMSSLGLPWDDGGDGIATLAADEDPLTTVGLFYGREGYRVQRTRSAQLAVVSDGWTVATAPTHAEVELSTGETITIPANSYQRRADNDRYFSLSKEVVLWEPRLRVEIGGSTMTIDGGSLTLSDLSSPLCAEGACVALVPDGTGGYGMSVTQYRWDTAFVTGEVNVVVTLLDAGGEPFLTTEQVVTFDDEVSVVFANEVSFVGDPLSAALAGRVNLLGAADERGAQATLASGRFHSTVARDASGDLGLAGVGVDEIAAMPATNFAVLLGGEPSVCGDDDGWFAPPPLAKVFGNGSGTKNASSQTSIRPQLL